MAQQQAETLKRAWQRARQNGLSVLGRGAWERNGVRFVVVGSASEPSRSHLVTVYPGRLTCDCQAGQYGRMCQHRALVHEELAAEAQHAAVAAQVIAATDAMLTRVVASECEEWQRERERDRRERERVRETALPAYRADNRPFSIWKA